jgi:hypothetical protein
MTRTGQVQRFGLITTNSLTMIFNRRVIEAQQNATPPLSLDFAIADHPWVDSADGAAVRIAMSVASVGQHEGRLVEVTHEDEGEDGEVLVTLTQKAGVIHSDLKVGANLTSTHKLLANERISSMGMMRAGNGFVVTETQANALGLGQIPNLEKHLRPFRNGRDLTDRPRGFWLIDLFDLSTEQVLHQFPAVYQHVLEHVKPERDLNRRDRLNQRWWIFGEPRQGLRPALTGLHRYIATVETAKHRAFQFLDSAVLPDHKLVAIAIQDGLYLGILSSQTHVIWALGTGGRLGVGNDPVYSK